MENLLFLRPFQIVLERMRHGMDVLEFSQCVLCGICVYDIIIFEIAWKLNLLCEKLKLFLQN